ncbi:MAG: hypothetical protein R3B48_29235 [Kofleriaceae bacterium]
MKITPTAIGLLVALSACDDAAGPAPGDDVWSDAVRSLTLANEGGGLAIKPPGSECNVGAAEYTLTVSDKKLDSVQCEAASRGAPLLNVTRSQTLSEAEFAGLEPNLMLLKVVDSNECGADKPAITLKVTTPAGTNEYRDSFYACIQDPRPMIDTNVLSQLDAKFRSLVTP